MKNIGIDIGKRRCIVCIMDEDGDILKETGYDNTFDAAKVFAEETIGLYEACRAVCESTGNLWIKTFDAFEKSGISIVLANPMKVRAIAEASIKTDKVDARTLASLLRANLIPKCHVANMGIRGVRQVLRNRTNLVQDRTRTINRTRNLLDKYDLKQADIGSDMWRKRALGRLTGRHLDDPNDDLILHQYARHIDYLNGEMSLVEKNIARQAAASEDARIMMSMTGIDYYAAMLLVAEIDGIERFRTSKRLVSWAGLCPTVHQSGDTPYHGKMKRDSNKRVNWIAIQCANVAVQYDERMKRFYERMRKRHMHNIAITHVANKMMVIIWHMLTDRTLYKERKDRLYQKKLKKMSSLR